MGLPSFSTWICQYYIQYSGWETSHIVEYDFPHLAEKYSDWIGSFTVMPVNQCLLWLHYLALFMCFSTQSMIHLEYMWVTLQKHLRNLNTEAFEKFSAQHGWPEEVHLNNSPELHCFKSKQNSIKHPILRQFQLLLLPLKETSGRDTFSKHRQT